LGTQVSWTLDDRQWYADSSRDVSSSGMMLCTQQLIEIGSSIQLSFTLPNLRYQDPVVAKAEVVRVVQRQGRQIGLGLRFLTLGSQNYRVVHEFVCRILDLPLDETMAGLASHTKAGYSFKMERLIEEAEARKAEVAERKLVRDEALRRKTAARIWTRRGVRTGLVLLSIFLVFKVADFVLDLTSLLQ
jgi:Tfp pilus assembly protein PilZ